MAGMGTAAEDTERTYMNYRELLEHSFRREVEWGGRGASRLEYLADNIFEFTTYDGEISELFASMAVEVCAAISNRTAFDYIKDPDNYRWYLVMCNMPFFQGRLNWGTSIRGAWWDIEASTGIRSCGLWEGDKQTTEITFNADEWKGFISAVVAFAADAEPLPKITKGT
jgi:hypothetical protein